MEFPFFILLLTVSITTVSSASSTLDPKQQTALRSLGIPTTKDPCNATVCDTSVPFRHLLTLTLSNCSGDDISLTTTALKSLSTLKNLTFLHCPLPLVHFPSSLTLNLHSFTCIASLRKLTGVFLGRFRNLTDLTVTDVPIKASGPVIILGNLKKLQTVTISNCSLTGSLPKSWDHNLTYLDLSQNQLQGKIHPSITNLENLVSLNLSFNHFIEEIPAEIGDLMYLQNLSLSSNSLSGSLPESMAAIPSLTHLDLSRNQFNGTIPKFLAKMKDLKYLNLENNNFQGVLPFNISFIRKLQVFKVGENPNLCYNHSTISSKLKLGLAPCDKYGLPLSPPPAKSTDSGNTDSDEADYSGDSDYDNSSKKNGGHHGPNKVVLGVAIALASIIFLIIFLILLSKWCA